MTSSSQTFVPDRSRPNPNRRPFATRQTTLRTITFVRNWENDSPIGQLSFDLQSVLEKSKDETYISPVPLVIASPVAQPLPVVSDEEGPDPGGAEDVIPETQPSPERLPTHSHHGPIDFDIDEGVIPDSQSPPRTKDVKRKSARSTEKKSARSTEKKAAVSKEGLSDLEQSSTAKPTKRRVGRPPSVKKGRNNKAQNNESAVSLPDAASVNRTKTTRSSARIQNISSQSSDPEPSSTPTKRPELSHREEPSQDSEHPGISSEKDAGTASLEDIFTHSNMDHSDAPTAADNTDPNVETTAPDPNNTSGEPDVMPDPADIDPDPSNSDQNLADDTEDPVNDSVLPSSDGAEPSSSHQTRSLFSARKRSLAATPRLSMGDPTLNSFALATVQSGPVMRTKKRIPSSERNAPPTDKPANKKADKTSAPSDKSANKKADKTPGYSVRIWQGDSGKRKMTDILDLDVILNCFEETAWEMRQELESVTLKRAVNTFAKKTQQDLRDTISATSDLKKQRTSLNKSRNQLNKERKMLFSTQVEYTELLNEVGTLQKGK